MLFSLCHIYHCLLQLPAPSNCAYLCLELNVIHTDCEFSTKRKTAAKKLCTAWYRTEEIIVCANAKERYLGAKICDTNEPINFYTSRMSLEVEIICGSHTQQSPSRSNNTKIELINYKWICVQSSKVLPAIKSSSIFVQKHSNTKDGMWIKEEATKKIEIVGKRIKSSPNATNAAHLRKCFVNNLRKNETLFADCYLIQSSTYANIYLRQYVFRFYVAHSERPNKSRFGLWNPVYVIGFDRDVFNLCVIVIHVEILARTQRANSYGNQCVFILLHVVHCEASAF